MCPKIPMITIPTEPIGSIPRPIELIEEITNGDADDPALDPLYDAAIRDTIARFQETGSPVITDGEQRKYHNFWTYSVEGLPNTSPDGFKIPFAAGHTRRMPRLVRGPFRYKRYADAFLTEAMAHARVPVKQAIISPSALSLMYPAEGLADYSRDEFIDDLLLEHETEIRRCLQQGAHNVQVDFTRDAWRRRSIRADGCCLASSTSTTSPFRASRKTSARASACTPARAAIAIRRTAPTWTTPRCCRACSNGRRASSSSRSPSRRTAGAFSRRFASTASPSSASSS